MATLAELNVLHMIIGSAIQGRPVSLTADETKMVAKHIHRLLARDRNRAEAERRAKIARTLRNLRA